MKEYEYIVAALEGYLCDELTGVICSENYRNRSYEHGYRHIFNEYRRLHKEFEAGKEKFMDLEQQEDVKEEFQRRCQEKCKDVQNRFLKDIKECSDADMERFMAGYLEKLEEEENKTAAKRICLYPYLVSVLRKNRNGGNDDGKKF